MRGGYLGKVDQYFFSKQSATGDHIDFYAAKPAATRVIQQYDPPRQNIRCVAVLLFTQSRQPESGWFKVIMNSINYKGEDKVNDTLLCESKGFKAAGRDALAEIEAKVAALQHESPAVIYTCEPKSPYARVTIQGDVLGLFDCSAAHFLDTPEFWFSHLHPNDQSRMPDFSAGSATGRHVWQYRFRRRDGSYTWINDNLSVLRDEQGNLNWFVGICTNFSRTNASV